MNSTPSFTPSPRELDDLELLLDGTFAPLEGFCGRADLASIRSRGTLADGTPWRAEITLTVPADFAGGVEDGVDLTDVEGVPIARLTVRARWRRHDDAPGTPAVARESWFLSGSVTPLSSREEGIFRGLRLRPAEIRARYEGRRITAVPLDAPFDTPALAALQEAAPKDGLMLLLPLIGAGTPRLVSPAGLVRTALATARRLPGEALVVPVPLASRGDPGQDAWLADRVARAYADEVVPGSVPADRLAAIAQALDEDTLTPHLVPDEIVSILRQVRPPLHRRGLTVMFTGLSGSGKSTIARRVRDLLLERGDRTVTLLDGDVVRRLLSAGLGFSRADRDANIRRIGYVAAEVTRHGGVALCAPIAPYAGSRADARHLVEQAGGDFVLIHVATPLAECERRDRKGLYAKARAGKIPAFTGISDPYEVPADADLSLDTSQLTVAEAVAQVMDLLSKRGWLPAHASNSRVGG